MILPPAQNLVSVGMAWHTDHFSSSWQGWPWLVSTDLQILILLCLLLPRRHLRVFWTLFLGEFAILLGVKGSLTGATEIEGAVSARHGTEFPVRRVTMDPT